MRISIKLNLQSPKWFVYCKYTDKYLLLKDRLLLKPDRYKLAYE